MSKFIIERQGDLFNSDAEVLGHGVNTEGLMGAGIARQFRAIYPEMFWDYKERCLGGLLVPGTTMIWESEEKWVANIASQDLPGANARYGWLTTGLIEMYGVVASKNPDWTIALPQIGCGIGGLDWDIVKDIISGMADFYEVKTELWTFS